MDIRMLDLYGLQPGMLYKNKHKFKTYFGVAFSALTLAVFTLLISISADEIVNKNKPLVIQSILIKPDPAEFTFTSNNFAFAGSLEYSNAKFYIDESVYSLKMFEKTHIMQENGNYSIEERQLKTTRCSNLTTDFVQNKIPHFPLETMYCPAEEESFSARGVFGSEIYRTVDVRIHKCDPMERTCKSREEIDEILRNGYFGFQFADSTFEPTNANEPFSKYAGNYFTTISPVSSKFISLTLNRNVSNTDFGFIMESLVQKEDFSVEAYDESAIGPNGDEILSLHFFFTNKLKEYNRTYTKIQRVVAEVVTATKVVMIICNFLVGRVAESQLYLSICDDFFSTKGNNKNKVIKHISTLRPVSESVANINVRQAKKPEFLLPENKTFFILKSIICLKSRSFKQESAHLNKRMNQIKDKLNISNMLELHSDIRLLMLILLEDYQQRFIDSFELKKKSTVNLFSNKRPKMTKDVTRDPDFALISSKETAIDRRIMAVIDKDKI